ncbi:unnamed protein product [Periconia digitata]|uniref:Uncharacterized protein n=1 Tax=Periconia digitata TaxID=1303443 RepID=A0A9W4XLV8_9PLEO|nr:unnamed protein product [Periconia digitata]
MRYRMRLEVSPEVNFIMGDFGHQITSEVTSSLRVPARAAFEATSVDNHQKQDL